MASTSPSQDLPAGPGPVTLAEVLARGPLPLVEGLRCAKEVARLLRELHQQNRAYGHLSAECVLLRGSNVELLARENNRRPRGEERDLESYGGLLSQIVSAAAPPPSAAVEGVRASALRLAERCSGRLPGTPGVRQVAMEVRLLWMLARQSESGAFKEEGRSAPFVIKPPQPEPVGPALLVVPVTPESFTAAPAKEAELERVAGTCPRCDSPSVYPSRPRSGFERLLVRWRMPIRRFHRGYHRYVTVAGIRLGKEMPAGGDRPLKPKRRVG